MSVEATSCLKWLYHPLLVRYTFLIFSTNVRFSWIILFFVFRLTRLLSRYFQTNLSTISSPSSNFFLYLYTCLPLVDIFWSFCKIYCLFLLVVVVFHNSINFLFHSLPIFFSKYPSCNKLLLLLMFLLALYCKYFHSGLFLVAYLACALSMLFVRFNFRKIVWVALLLLQVCSRCLCNKCKKYYLKRIL